MAVPWENSIHTEYFDLYDGEGLPLAGLLIVSNQSGKPVRAELHVGADSESAEVEECVRQAHRLLGEKFTLPGGGTLPLYVLRFDLKNVVDVRLPSSTPPILHHTERRETKSASVGAVSSSGSSGGGRASSRGGRSRAGGISRYVTATLVIFALVLVVWTISAFRNSRSQNAVASADSIVTELDEMRVTGADNGTDTDLPDDATATALAIQLPTATPTETPVPVVLDSYCMWPGDTLSEIAVNAGVSENAILALNPNFNGQAGSTIQLPPGSIAPASWTEPMPVVNSIEDIPFGISGYYIGYDNRQKRIALSFDVGYVKGNKGLMELLAARGIKATFFVLGSAVENHPEMIADILNNGHELGNHSFTHDNMQVMAGEEIAQELMVTEDLVQAAYPGATTKPIFRAPFGALNDTVIEVSNEQGYHLIGWTVDSRDWTDEITADSFYDRVTRLVCPGAIIAMHDVNPANSTALPQVLDFLENNEYEFVTVSEILFPEKQ